MSTELINVLRTSRHTGFELVPAKRSNENKLAILSGKKRSRWESRTLPRRGRRWGTRDDRPYLPPSFVDLPFGLNSQQVEQFFKEQRVNELEVKLRLGNLEVPDQDIRPPSPPPIYDTNGNRTNTIEQIVQKQMDFEYDRLVRDLIKTLPGYQPPSDYKPLKLVKKLVMPVDQYPHIQFMAIIVGARGITHKNLQIQSGCRIEVRGRNVVATNQPPEEAELPQHVHVEGDTEEQIQIAEDLIAPMLDPTHPDFERYRTEGLQQLALVSGKPTSLSEYRCPICMALGHIAADCPEGNGGVVPYANVKCDICGDRGHVTSDCPEHPDKILTTKNWKKEAEKRQQANKEYHDLMGTTGTSDGAVMKNIPSVIAQEKLLTNIERINSKNLNILNNIGLDTNLIERELVEVVELLPVSKVATFIGKDGAHIVAVQETLGVKIRLDNIHKDYVIQGIQEVPIYISGPARNVKVAQEQIKAFSLGESIDGVLPGIGQKDFNLGYANEFVNKTMRDIHSIDMNRMSNSNILNTYNRETVNSSFYYSSNAMPYVEMNQGSYTTAPVNQPIFTGFLPNEIENNNHRTETVVATEEPENEGVLNDVRLPSSPEDVDLMTNEDIEKLLISQGVDLSKDCQSEQEKIDYILNYRNYYKDYLQGLN